MNDQSNRDTWSGWWRPGRSSWQVDARLHSRERDRGRRHPGGRGRRAGRHRHPTLVPAAGREGRRLAAVVHLKNGYSST
jgi:hypothetical protein